MKLRRPYKIAPHRAKRYESHYHIPAERSLVVPIRALGDEVSCDIRWEDDNGEIRLLENKIFVEDSLTPLSAFLDPKLHELWLHYYEMEPKADTVDNETT